MTKGRCITIVLIAIWYIVWIYGKVCGFDWLILWLVAFLFIPVIYFHMAGQWDCMIYPGIYIVVMSLGMVVGRIFQKKKVV